MRVIQIYDTTLRDGAQGEGVSFSLQDKLLITQRLDEMGFDYRSSRIPEIGWLLDVTFRLERQDPPSIKQCIREMLKSRNQAQPVNQPSAGCIFKNSSGDHASRLLDTAGVKGKRVGAAEFSMKHANFIVNLGGACASDVLDLASQARDLVYGRHGVSLDYEVRVVGE